MAFWIRVLAVALAALALTATPAVAQEPGATTTSLAPVPAQDIVPQPNTGTAPEEPGDRGGTLQLAVLSLVVVAIGAGVVVVIRQAQRARETS